MSVFVSECVSVFVSECVSACVSGCVSVFVGAWVGDCALVGLKVRALLQLNESLLWELSLARQHNKELT